MVNFCNIHDTVIFSDTCFFLQKMTKSEAKKQVPAFISIDRNETSDEGDGPWTDLPQSPTPKPIPVSVGELIYPILATITQWFSIHLTFIFGLQIAR